MAKQTISSPGLAAGLALSASATARTTVAAKGAATQASTVDAGARVDVAAKGTAAQTATVNAGAPVTVAAKGTAAQIATVIGRISRLVDAAGSATQHADATALGVVSLGGMIEIAMAQAITDIQAESEAIWAESGSTEADKRARIAALNMPANKRARVMQYRDQLRADWYAAAILGGGPPQWLNANPQQ
jgi:ssDNA-binding replication factor A large subunit